MRNFKQEIDSCNDPNELREILAELSEELEMLEDLPYADLVETRRAHDLELMLRYGELKLDKILM